VFSVLQEKVLTPDDFDGTRDIERRLWALLAERNRTAGDPVELHIEKTPRKIWPAPATGGVPLRPGTNS
jgi:hypothetical protein